MTRVLRICHVARHALQFAASFRTGTEAAAVVGEDMTLPKCTRQCRRNGGASNAPAQSTELIGYPLRRLRTQSVS